MLLALVPAMALTVAGCGDTSNNNDIGTVVDMATPVTQDLAKKD
jgi:hypothetical protein